MLPHRMPRPQVAIVGAGNVASAVARALFHAGYEVSEVVSRDRASSLERARRLARQVRSRAVGISRARLRASLIWFCVPDGEIAAAARSLVAAREWRGAVAFHSSGALTSDELQILRSEGASVASVHPLMTFVRGSRPSLAGVPFAIEGDRAAVREGREILRNLQAPAFPIRKQDKAAYHAWGMFASPLLIALLAATERVARKAGVSTAAARKRMLPIVAQTVANYAALGPAEAFSGPIVRGDAATVSKHLQVLRGDQVLLRTYVALARAALEYLPVKNRSALEKLLAL